METINLAYGIFIGGIAAICLLCCLYYCYRGYVRTHRKRVVYQNGIKMLDEPSPTWGKYQGKAQTAGLLVAMCLLLLLFGYIWTSQSEQSDPLKAPTRPSTWGGD